VSLRPYRGRLVCDSCGGIMLVLADLDHAIEDIAGIAPAVTFVHEAAGARPCPECGAAMMQCHVAITLDGDTIKTKPTLDRCADHGVWFDTEELAAVLEKASRKRVRPPRDSKIPWLSFPGRGPRWPGT